MKMMPAVFTLTVAAGFFVLAPMQAQQKFGFLEGRWNARLIVHYPLFIPEAGTFDKSFFHADIAIKDAIIVIKVVYDSGGEVAAKVYGKINGSDLDSIKWTFTSGDAAEVYITPDHENVHIYMPLSNKGRTEPHGQEIYLSR